MSFQCNNDEIPVEDSEGEKQKRMMKKVQKNAISAVAELAGNIPAISIKY